MNIIKRLWYRFRSSITGRWVTEAEARANPKTTQKERP